MVECGNKHRNNELPQCTNTVKVLVTSIQQCNADLDPFCGSHQTKFSASQLHKTMVRPGLQFVRVCGVCAYVCVCVCVCLLCVCVCVHMCVCVCVCVCV